MDSTKKMRIARLCLGLALLFTLSFATMGCNPGKAGKSMGQKTRKGVEGVKQGYHGFKEGYRGK